tara:strand:- start:43 stop:240 length:198 start_codon:yes stop_codon:yes gene_type:complete
VVVAEVFIIEPQVVQALVELVVVEQDLIYKELQVVLILVVAVAVVTEVLLVVRVQLPLVEQAVQA